MCICMSSIVCAKARSIIYVRTDTLHCPAKTAVGQSAQVLPMWFMQSRAEKTTTAENRRRKTENWMGQNSWLQGLIGWDDFWVELDVHSVCCSGKRSVTKRLEKICRKVFLRPDVSATLLAPRCMAWMMMNWQGLQASTDDVYELWTGHILCYLDLLRIIFHFVIQSQLVTVNGVSGKCVGQLSMGFLATSCLGAQDDPKAGNLNIPQHQEHQSRWVIRTLIPINRVSAPSFQRLRSAFDTVHLRATISWPSSCGEQFTQEWE